MDLQDQRLQIIRHLLRKQIDHFLFEGSAHIDILHTHKLCQYVCQHKLIQLIQFHGGLYSQQDK